MPSINEAKDLSAWLDQGKLRALFRSLRHLCIPGRDRSYHAYSRKYSHCQCHRGVLLVHLGIVDTGSVADEDSTLGQVILGALVAGVILAVCHFVLELYWAITFSICVAYATNINEGVERLFHMRSGK